MKKIITSIDKNKLDLFKKLNLKHIEDTDCGNNMFFISSGYFKRSEFLKKFPQPEF